MMVVDSAMNPDVLTNKTAPITQSLQQKQQLPVVADIASTSTSTSTSSSSSLRRDNPSKRNNKQKKLSSSSSHTKKTIISDSLKKNIAKELKMKGGKGLNRSSSSSHSKSSSSSTKSSSSRRSSSLNSLKEEGEKKEKKSKKKSRSMISLSELENELESSGSNHNSSNHNHNSTNQIADEESSSSSSTGKIKVARGDLLSRYQALEIGSNTKSIRQEPSSSTTAKKNNNNSTSTSRSSPKSTSSSKKKKKKSSSSSEKTTTTTVADPSHGGDAAAAAAKAKPKPPSRPPDTKTSRERRELSFASIHGRSIHKTKKKRGSGTGTTSPTTKSHGVLSGSESDDNNGGKKKSKLKQKREKQQRQQLLNKKQQQQQSRGDGSSTGPPAVPPNRKEEYIQQSLDIVEDDANSNKTGSSSSGSIAGVDSYSSSVDDDCSIVSDGSYSAEDLLFGAEENTTPSSSSFNATNLYGGSFADNHSYANEDSFAEGDGSTEQICFDDSSPRRTRYDRESSRSIVSSDTITANLASSMSSFPEEDIDFTAAVTSSAPPSPSPQKTPSGRNLKSAFKKASPKSSSQRLKQLDSRVTAKRSEANILRVVLPGQTKTTIRRRSIDFNEKVRVKRVFCQAQLLEDDEIGELWFQHEEYEVIKRKTMALINAIQNDTTGGVAYCTRGLERYFSIAEVQETRNDAWDTVLDEQDLQRASGTHTFDADRVSRAYARCTRQSFLDAAARGKLDEDAIARYTRKTRQTMMDHES